MPMFPWVAVSRKWAMDGSNVKFETRNDAEWLLFITCEMRLIIRWKCARRCWYSCCATLDKCTSQCVWMKIFERYESDILFNIPEGIDDKTSARPKVYRSAHTTQKKTFHLKNSTRLETKWMAFSNLVDVWQSSLVAGLMDSHRRPFSTSSLPKARNGGSVTCGSAPKDSPSPLPAWWKQMSALCHRNDKTLFFFRSLWHNSRAHKEY